MPDIKSLESQIDYTKLPNHIAIIMDGNGRWAKERNLPRIFGHRAGMVSVRKVVELSVKIKLKCLSLYAFSTENWSRPQKEINGLFNLLKEYIKIERKNILKNNIKLKISGDLSELPKDIQKAVNNLVKETEHNTGLLFNLCINYGSRQEIVRAVNNIISTNVKNVTVESFSKYLYMNEFPDIDLLIRTSGEMRISNFMLWQSAYAEFYFTKTFWPDFREKEFYKAIIEFQKRERRFGGI
ncbi:MAG: isoprenyl transferase [Endomicrobiia bacterium]